MKKIINDVKKKFKEDSIKTVTEREGLEFDLIRSFLAQENHTTKEFLKEISFKELRKNLGNKTNSELHFILNSAFRDFRCDFEPCFDPDNCHKKILEKIEKSYFKKTLFLLISLYYCYRFIKNSSYQELTKASVYSRIFMLNN